MRELVFEVDFEPRGEGWVSGKQDQNVHTFLKVKMCKKAQVRNQASLLLPK